MLEKLNYRRYQPSDAETIAQIYRVSDAAIEAQHRMDAAAVRNFLAAPVIDPELDTFVVERDGQMVAFAYCEFASTGHCYADAVVDPAYWNQGMGTELLHLTEARTLERAAASLPPEQEIALDRGVGAGNGRAIRLFEKAGYDFIRSFNLMRIDFEQPLDLPPLPAGIRVRPFAQADTYAVYEANEEAFADHWEHEHRSFEEWQRQVLNKVGQDLSLWLVADDNGEIAGVCLNRPFGQDDPQLAWVGTLGVRRRWRKQGIGFALLLHSFALFQARGFTRAGLSVDASSPTNAGAIYERAGMRVHKRILVYRKVLREAGTDEG
ncbi:MAG TPA: GNAT family N-acetyltransferase [Phototrophicaceae bacterium]|nr:GNAT family N-acetyltransferase [Phototrophicaceae bacterium]